MSLLADGYPAWSLDSQSDAYWNTNVNNATAAGAYSQVGTWFNDCVNNPVYDRSAYPTPTFPAGFAGWVQANNWIIRTLVR